MQRRRILMGGVFAWVLWRLFGREAGPRHIGVQVRPAGPPSRTVVAGLHEFSVREAGPEHGPPVVLLHGWLYDGLATWHRVLPALAVRHRVYLIDLRNHGKSDRVRSRFDISDAADDVARVFDVLGLGAVPVVGFSMGGMVAQELALRHPGRVTRLILGATAAHPIPYPRWLTVPLFVIGRALSRIDRTLLPRIAYRYLMATGVFDAAHGAWLWQALMDRDNDLYYEGGFAILRFDARERVSRLALPVLMIVPTRDQLIPPRQQRATAAIVPGAQVVEIVGGRHESVLTHPGEVAAAIEAFVG